MNIAFVLFIAGALVLCKTGQVAKGGIVWPKKQGLVAISLITAAVLVGIVA